MSDTSLRLRQIREIQRAAATLTPERDWLVCQALGEGSDERDVARAAGITLRQVRDLRSSVPWEHPSRSGS